MTTTALAILLSSSPLFAPSGVDLDGLKLRAGDGSVYTFGEPPANFFASQDPTKPSAAKPTEQAKKPTADEQFQAELDKDKKQGKEASDYYDRTYPESKNVAAYDRVKRIGESLALIANSTPIKATWGDNRFAQFEYKFKLVESKDINAFSLPGGYIYVFEGLVDFVQSDDELAGVLAHEITHASERHVATLAKESAKLSKIQIPLILASILTGGVASGLGVGLFGSVYAGTAITNGWGQKAEESADYGGFQYISASKYNPTGMLTFMERLSLKDYIYNGPEVGIFRTHPPSKFRAERLEEYMKLRHIPIQRSKVTSSFKSTFVVKPDGTTDILFGKKKLVTLAKSDDAGERATKIVSDINNFMDSVPEMYDIQDGGDGVIYGQNRVLFRLYSADATVARLPLEKLQQDVVKKLKDSVFTIAYHAWDR